MKVKFKNRQVRTLLKSDIRESVLALNDLG